MPSYGVDRRGSEGARGEAGIYVLQGQEARGARRQGALRLGDQAWSTAFKAHRSEVAFGLSAFESFYSFSADPLYDSPDPTQATYFAYIDHYAPCGHDHLKCPHLKALLFFHAYRKRKVGMPGYGVGRLSGRSEDRVWISPGGRWT